MQVTPLRFRDQRLCILAQFLGLFRGRLDTAVQEQRRRHVSHHGVSVLRRAIELATFCPVPHRSTYSCSASRREPTSASAPPLPCSTRYSSPFSPDSSFMPKCRLCSFRN